VDAIHRSGVTFKDGNGPFFPFMPNVDLVILTARGQKVFIQTAKTGMNCVEPLSHTLEFSDEASVDEVPHVDALSGDV